MYSVRFTVLQLTAAPLPSAECLGLAIVRKAISFYALSQYKLYEIKDCESSMRYRFRVSNFVKWCFVFRQRTRYGVQHTPRQGMICQLSESPFGRSGFGMERFNSNLVLAYCQKNRKTFLQVPLYWSREQNRNG